MTVVTDRESLDRTRKAKGLSLAKLARTAQVPYQRVWRFFTFEASLTDEEIVRLGTVVGDREEVGDLTVPVT